VTREILKPAPVHDSGEGDDRLATSGIELDLTATKVDRAAAAAESAWRSAQLFAERAWRNVEPPRDRDDFDNLHADLQRVLYWIAFRRDPIPSPTAEDRRDELYRRLSYEEAKDVVVGNPQRTLALALRRGELVGFDETGQSLSPEFWAHQGFDWRRWPKVVFRWKDVVAAFPTSGPSVRDVLSELLTANPKLTQNQAWDIIKSRCENARRQDIRDLWETLGGLSRPGPRGPRKNSAESLA
jgi:hypothetical protein